jgi:hypothetical protein
MSTITTNEVNKYSADKNAELEKAIKLFFEIQKIELKKALGVFFTNQNIALHNTFSKFFENGSTEYELIPVRSNNTNVVNQNIQSDTTLEARLFGNSNVGFFGNPNPNSSGGFANPNPFYLTRPSASTFSSNPSGPYVCGFGSKPTGPSEKSNLSKRKEREEEDIKPIRKTRQAKK